MPKEGRAGKNQIRDHKIKQLGALHPNSRKAAQKQGELLHDDKKAMHILTKDLKWKPQLQKFQWFQKAVWMDQKKMYTVEELTALAAEYVTRNDELIADAIHAATIGGGKGKLAPTSSAWQKLKVREAEESDFAAGELVIPDMIYPKVVRAVNDWRTGNVDQMHTIRTGKYGKEGQIPVLYETTKK
uniref:Translation machinery-associated protein 16 n=1 Tax=Hemiselmis andersenii TaxID=464988 RepID=A0A7S1DMT3_HEMAN